MADTAGIMQRIYAGLSSNIAVSDDGYLIDQETGEYLNPGDLNAWQSLWFEPIHGYDGFKSNGEPSDTDAFSDPNNYASDALDAANNSALQQQESAQTSADRAMEFEKEYADKYMNFQKEMAETAWNREMDAANTSYQRMMADLKAAGLNPKLAGKLGGAATPSYDIDSTYSAQGKTASMQMSNLSVLGSVLSSYITGADALDRNQNDFVKSIISTLLSVSLK